MNQRWVYMCPPSCPLPPPFPSHPSELSQCTSFECPLSCIELGLVIYFIYGNIHFSMLFSQIIPPSPSSTGEGNGTPLQYSCLGNPMDGRAWWAGVHGVVKSWTWLSDFTFTFHFHALEKEMATHSSVLAWRIPGTGKPSGLPSMGSHRVGHDWSDLAAAAAPSSTEFKSVFFISVPLLLSCL